MNVEVTFFLKEKNSSLMKLRTDCLSMDGGGGAGVFFKQIVYFPTVEKK